VLSSDRLSHLPIRLVVPLTTWQARLEFHYNKARITATAGAGFSRDSAADVMQMRSVSTTRCVRRLGTLAADDLAQLAANIAIAIADG